MNKWHLTKQTKKVIKKRGKFKSFLEKRVSDALKKVGVFTYETLKLPYITPVERHTYTPDFVGSWMPIHTQDIKRDRKDGLIIEAKGRLTIADRKKMLLVREQYPNKEFYLVFGNANEKLYKGSKTTYGQWATKHGFEWCSFYKSGIPKGWFK